jgi:hypothetical protein
MLEATLAQHRDDLIPLVVSAVEADSDVDWLATMVMDDEFDATDRAQMAILNVKKILEKFSKFATDDEKKTLASDKAVFYLDRVQKRINELQKQEKQLEMMRQEAMQAAIAAEQAKKQDGAAQSAAAQPALQVVR